MFIGKPVAAPCHEAVSDSVAPTAKADGWPSFVCGYAFWKLTFLKSYPDILEDHCDPKENEGQLQS